MAIVPVNIGSAANDGTGDPLRTAFGKLNTSISELAPLASPALTGNPTAPTQTLGNNTTRIATTAFVKAAIDALVEEGTWTPALTFGGGSTGLTYSARAGSYTKIGNRVIVDGRMTLSAKGSSTGTALVGGLPFTVGGSTWRAVPIPYYLNVALTGGLAEAASTNIRLYKSGSTAATHADFADDSSIYFTLTYTV